MTDATIRFAFDRTTRSYDVDGRLHVRIANISKANICGYYGREIPNAEALGLEPNTLYQLWRHPDELAKAAPTFNNIQLLGRHIPVSADDPKKDDVVGSTGTDAAFDGTYLTNSLVIWDAEAIAGIETRDQCELSCGYRYRLDLTPGTSEGLRYDGIMRDIVGNHVALVEAGRAGSDVVVGDSKLETGRMATKPLTSRTALMVKGSLIPVLMALDAKVDLNPILRGVTAKNYADKKADILGAIKVKLASDADLKPIQVALDAMEKEAEDEEEEEKAEDEDPEGEESGEDEEAKELEEENEKAKDKKAKDRKRRGGRDSDPMNMPGVQLHDAKAMDAAIAKATAQVRADARALREAEIAVRPYVGDVAAMDSAADVYRFALDSMGVDTRGVHESALPALLKLAPKPNDNAKPMALDSKGVDGLTKKFPGLSRIGRAG